MRITPLDIHEQTFRTAFRGFDPVEVDGFLQRVADELERLMEERETMKAELDRERKVRETLEEALTTAQSLQEGILERARQEAELTRNQAQIRADRVLAEANEELLMLRRDIHELRERRSLWLAELAGLARALEGWATDKAQQPVVAPELIQDPQDPAEEPTPAGDEVEEPMPWEEVDGS